MKVWGREVLGKRLGERREMAPRETFGRGTGVEWSPPSPP